MPTAKLGDTVKVHYVGTLDDGTVFDSSHGGEPLSFRIGDEQLIPGFEQAVIGMTPGEVKRHTIPFMQAYGPHLPEMVIEVDRSQMPADLEPEVGEHLNVEQEDGSVFPVMVVAVTERSVQLDANHPLAGKDLTFEIKLLEIL